MLRVQNTGKFSSCLFCVGERGGDCLGKLTAALEMNFKRVSRSYMGKSDLVAFKNFLCVGDWVNLLSTQNMTFLTMT